MSLDKEIAHGKEKQKIQQLEAITIHE